MLLLDVGNSRCKWARVENGQWLQQGVANNADWPALRRVLGDMAPPDMVRISNVAGHVMAQHLQAFCAGWPCATQFVQAQVEQCGVRNLYEQPSQLGSDRWMALVAAWDRVRGACLVVNFGTATTVDSLSAEGEFLGGLILPGVALMRASLAANTAQLDMADGELREFPRNTADAILSGVMRATMGAIHGQYAMLATRQGAHCVISGGAASMMQSHLEIPCEYVDNLVLQGLYITGLEAGA